MKFGLKLLKPMIGLAEHIFNRLTDCNSCYPVCLAKMLYKFNGKKMLNCHGRVVLRMDANDFNKIREFFRHLNKFIEQKIINGDPPPEKIVLMNIRRN